MAFPGVVVAHPQLLPARGLFRTDRLRNREIPQKKTCADFGTTLLTSRSLTTGACKNRRKEKKSLTYLLLFMKANRRVQGSMGPPWRHAANRKRVSSNSVQRIESVEKHGAGHGQIYWTNDSR